MKDRHESHTPSNDHGAGIKLVLLALLLIAIAAAIDIAWMTPGRATMPARTEPVAEEARDAPPATDAGATMAGRTPGALSVHAGAAGDSGSHARTF